ncbi:hypothetical protein DRJ19_03780 [Candidatus Woesearchaeota archaeon]|nr:MAG: hypothetical protein DRJ19_03780 [Candidatus Woesearchaeota archaeon]
MTLNLAERIQVKDAGGNEVEFMKIRGLSGYNLEIRVKDQENNVSILLRKEQVKKILPLLYNIAYDGEMVY